MTSASHDDRRAQDDTDRRSGGQPSRQGPAGSQFGDEMPPRVGITLPTFRDDLLALHRAAAAERLGVDGVFVFDHLWPMGRPDRPALAAFPMLAAVAASTDQLMLGPLVARVGLVPDEVLLARFGALGRLAPGRVVAALGTGDDKSAAEHTAYGVPLRPAAERLRSLERCATCLRDEGLPVWLGGRSAAVAAVASSVGVAVNLWEAPATEVARRSASVEVTWAGSVPDQVDEALAQVLPLVDAGARWVVCAAPASVGTVAAVATVVRRQRVAVTPRQAPDAQ